MPRPLGPGRAESIVGYAQNALDNDYGAVMTGAQFVNCTGTGEIALASLSPKAENMTADDLAGYIEIQTLDHAGRTVDSYVWNGEGWEGDDETTFPAGTGLWVFNQVGADTKVSLQSSGQVTTSDVVIMLDSDYGAIGIANPFPVSVTLAEILPECGNMTAEELAGYVEIQTLDHAGQTVDSYVWNGEGWEGDDEEKEIEAGTGLWVFNQVGNDSAVSLRIPAPEL